MPPAPPPGLPPPALIATTEALDALCRRLAAEAFVTVDTEFMRERTYWPILCVVQVAGPGEAIAIDALAEDIDLKPLLALMSDPDTLKVFHAARQDLEIFFQLSGEVPHPVFDTQVAAISVRVSSLTRRWRGMLARCASRSRQAASARNMPR